jgi:hypothetical protein
MLGVGRLSATPSARDDPAVTPPMSSCSSDSGSGAARAPEAMAFYFRRITQ